MFDLFRKAPADTPTPDKPSWTERLKAGLGLSREKIAGALGDVFVRRVLDDSALEELENALLGADVGVDATEHLLEALRVRWKRAGANADPRETLAEAMVELIAPLEQPLVVGPQRPFVIMLTGVNGAGKTTSIGKLAKWLQSQRPVRIARGGQTRSAQRRASNSPSGANATASP